MIIPEIAIIITIGIIGVVLIFKDNAGQRRLPPGGNSRSR